MKAILYYLFSVAALPGMMSRGVDALVLPDPAPQASAMAKRLSQDTRTQLQSSPCGSPKSIVQYPRTKRTIRTSELSSDKKYNMHQRFAHFGVAASLSAAALLTVAPRHHSNTAMAYDPTDYASETVQTTIKALKETAGNAEATYKVYEEMNSIITEGKGVGGAINYKGVQLDRGYVADEDTSIYNPGLTLLTESEKERLVEAVIQNRKVALQQHPEEWSQTNQLAFEFLREKLDPFHVTELRGYLGVLPFYAAAVYLGVLAIQQLARDFFPAAYIVGVVAVVAPALILLALGPS